MSFVELPFLACFAALVAAHWALPPGRARKALLLAASYSFYAAWDYRFLTLIWLSTAVDFAWGRRMPDASPARRKALLLLSLTVNLGLLFTFKYYGFFVDSLAALLTALGLQANLPTLAVILPVGISFYTFQTLSYTIDVYRGKLAPTDSPLDFALFVAFFPQLVAGPIVRATEFLHQLDAPRPFARVRVRRCVYLILVGYFKKACVADNLAWAVDAVHADPAGHAASALWLAQLLFAVQIYCDFSGYSDLAIGLAGLLGFQLPLNFAHPYFARSLTSLWRRWHVSLTRWLLDYVYIPLGGSRRGRLRTLLNLLLTFTLCGLWHGADWTFVLWGFLNGVVIVGERLLSWATGRDPDHLLPAPLGVAVSFGLFLLGLVLVRSPTLDHAWVVLRGGAGLGAGATTLPPDLLVVVALLLAVHALTSFRLDLALVDRLPAPLFALLCGAGLELLIALRAVHYRPFYYFQF